MKERLIQSEIAIRPSPIHGFGIFAEKSIKKGEIVEECPYILVEGNEKALSNYYFEVQGVKAFLTGYGALYNHSAYPNLGFNFDSDRKLAVFIASKNIKTGEELFISYGTGWFSERNMRMKEPFKWRAMLDIKNSILLRAFLASILVLATIKLLVYLK